MRQSGLRTDNPQVAQWPKGIRKDAVLFAQMFQAVSDT
jgi:hypothetical protein